MSEEAQSILILDDDDAVRESIVCYFEDRGWSVIAAASAEEALRMIVSDRPTAAVVDIRLPGMDGSTFIRQAKQVHFKLACVIVTGSPEYHLPQDVAALSGVSDLVFSKPVKDLGALESQLLQQVSTIRESGNG